MKNYLKAFKKSVVIFLIFTIVCGLFYTFSLQFIGNSLFSRQVNGSVITIDGVEYGSELLAQPFNANDHLWGRVSVIDEQTYKDNQGNKLIYGSASNMAVASKEYEEAIANRVKAIKSTSNQTQQKKIPVDLITASGSGLDPHISYAAALYQIPRLSKYTNYSAAEIKAIINRYTNEPIFGFLGEKTVHVLKVNLALDGILKA